MNYTDRQGTYKKHRETGKKGKKKQNKKWTSQKQKIGTRALLTAGI